MSNVRLLAIASLFAANSAGAQVLLNSTFDGLNGGNSQLNYATLPNFTVLSGTIDLVKSGDFGITCFGGSGSCIDLDGSTGVSGRIGTQTFFFGAGDTFTLSFDASGNQRQRTTLDVFNLEFAFGSATPYTNLFGSGLTSGAGNGTFGPNLTLFSTLLGSDPWISTTFGFTFVNAGQVAVSFSTTGNDNVGPILDNVVITRTAPQAVPEPSSYVLMAAGLGGLVLAARRRRA